jgi:predicted phage-related endonuclease
MTYLDRMVQYADKEEWLASRRDHIGASEIAACLGLSTFADASPFRVWQNKAQPDEAEPMTPERQRGLNRGNRAEGAILGEFADDHHEFIVEPKQLCTIAHPYYPLIRCTPDALIWNHGDIEDLSPEAPPVAVVDAKFVEVYSKKHYGESGSDIMPADYVMQGLLLCECLEVEECFFAVWIGRWEYREFLVRRNEKVAEGLIQKALDWFDKYVVAKRYPPLDDSPQAAAFVKSLYPQANRDILLPSNQAVHDWATEREVAADEERRAKKRKVALQTKISEYIGDAAGIDGICTYKNVAPSVSWKKAAAQMSALLTSPQIQAAMLNATGKVGSRKYHSTLGKD